MTCSAMNRADRLAAFPYSAYRIRCNAWDMGEMQVMRDRGIGRIVFVSSVSAERGGGLFAPLLFGSEGRRARVCPRAGPRVGAEWRDG
jgi:hypothetical protein